MIHDCIIVVIVININLTSQACNAIWKIKYKSACFPGGSWQMQVNSPLPILLTWVIRNMLGIPLLNNSRVKLLLTLHCNSKLFQSSPMLQRVSSLRLFPKRFLLEQAQSFPRGLTHGRASLIHSRCLARAMLSSFLELAFDYQKSCPCPTTTYSASKLNKNATHINLHTGSTTSSVT